MKFERARMKLSPLRLVLWVSHIIALLAHTEPFFFACVMFNLGVLTSIISDEFIRLGHTTLGLNLQLGVSLAILLLVMLSFRLYHATRLKSKNAVYVMEVGEEGVEQLERLRQLTYSESPVDTMRKALGVTEFLAEKEAAGVIVELHFPDGRECAVELFPEKVREGEEGGSDESHGLVS